MTKTMLLLQATIRDNKSKNKHLRNQGFLPAVLYGEAVQNTPLKVNLREFQRIFSQAGESSLVALEVDEKKYNVLIHQIDRDPVSDEFIHADFYHPSTKKKVEAEISLVFIGESLAVKDFGGILIKEIQTVKVKGLAHKLPREITVDISCLQDFNARILVKDLILSEGIEVQRGSDEIVALVVPAKEEKPEVIIEPATPVVTEAVKEPTPQ